MTKSVEPDKKAERLRPEAEFRPDEEGRPIWEVIEDIMRRVPDEVLRRLPADGAEQHDHYLYGSPKKAPRTS